MTKKFKSGDRVQLKGTNYVGEITIANSESQISGCLSSKVLFDDDDGPNYWYYPNDELELISPEEKTK